MGRSGHKNIDPNLVSDMVAMAKERVRHAERGDDQAAREVLRQASVAIRDVLNGQQPDGERLEYLRYLGSALDSILNEGIAPSKALGTYTTNRPREVDIFRDINLFVAVGLAYEQKGKVKDAKKAVSRTYGIGASTIDKAWTQLGGLSIWCSLGPHETFKDAIIAVQTEAARQASSLPPGLERSRLLKIASLDPDDLLKRGNMPRP